MSQSTPTPIASPAFTTTFSTSHSATSFTRPTAIPSSMVPFGPALSCSAQPSALAPQGSAAACAISNARETNDHAFWDLYACCKDGDITATGMPNPCAAQCVAKGQEWRELGECLSKKVDIVVCKAGDGEVGSSSSSVTGSATSAPSASASGDGPSASSSTGAASVVGAVHVGGSKAAAVLFGTLAIVSFAGMLL